MIEERLLPSVLDVRPERHRPDAPAVHEAVEPRQQARSLRVLLVASEGPPVRSGVARSIATLRAGLIERGHAVDVLAYPTVPRWTVGEVRITGLALKLREIVRRLGEYDVVHLHGVAPTSSDLFLLLARLAGKRPPLVYTHHFDLHVDSGGALNTLYNRVHHTLNGWADEVVTTTAGYATRVGAAGKVSVIHNGVDLAHFASDAPKDAQFTVLFVGQFRRYKGVRVLLEAMATVSGACLLVAGSGPEKEAYQRLAGRLGLDVEFHDVTDEGLRRLYQRAHAIVLPSTTPFEAFGLVLLEGMAAGCVPIASDLLGVREVVGRVGFTVPAGDAPALAKTLRHLRDHPRLSAEIAPRARARARTFDWSSTIEAYEQLYRDVVAVRRLGRDLEQTSGPAGAPAWQAFAGDVAASRAADVLEIGSGDAQQSARRIALVEDICEARADAVAHDREIVARFALANREPVLATGDCTPAPLAGRLRSPFSWVAVPVTSGDRAIGVVVAGRRRPFGESDLAALTRLARHIAPLINPPPQRGGKGARGHA